MLPEGSERLSGGNIYNAELIRALRRTAAVTSIRMEECKRSIARGEPGIYFIDTLSLHEFLALPFAGAEQRLVLIVHHLPSLEPGIDPEGDALRVEAEALARFDGYLTTSPFSAEHLGSRGIPRAKIMTVLPGLQPVHGAARVYEAPLRALCVGNLIPGKAVVEFLRVLAPRRQEGDSFTIDILGRTDVDLDYTAACHAFSSTWVRVLGPVPYERINRHYATAHAFISTSRMETFGMALAEARAHGLPILGLDRGHVRSHFTHGENGLLFESIEELADGFLALARDDRTMADLFARAQSQRAGAERTWSAAAACFLRELERWSQAHG